MLDEGLDELAARSHEGFPLRVAITVAVAVLCATLADWRQCFTWAALQTTSESIGWVMSRAQARGGQVMRRDRLGFLATLAFGCTSWMTLAGLMWVSPTSAGPVAAALLALSVIFFTQTNAYQSTLGFVVGGALPGIGMLVFLALGPNPHHIPRMPTLGLTVMALAFATDGVLRARQARRAFDQARDQLAASERAHRTLADNVSDIIALNTLDGRRLYLSPSARTTFGYDLEDIWNNNFATIHSEDARMVGREVAAMVERGDEITLQYRMVHKDGRAIWVETNFSVAPGDGPDGPPMIVSVTRNIEARKALETELLEARRRAEDAAAAKSDFLANMTHELRTPLNAIIGFSEVLRRSPRLKGDDLRHAGLIYDASETLLELVNSVLDFSKLEAGAVTLETRPFDPEASVRSVVSLLEPQAQAKGLSLSVRTEGGASILLGDDARLRQVVLNYLSNAMKFTLEGGITVTVRETPLSTGLRKLRIEVADTGIGVTPDQLDHLFDRFTQADASVSREFGGTGLGLAICKRTLELMGGQVGASSSPGEGSTFWLEVALPASDAPLAAPAEAAVDGPDRPVRMLLVEDVAVNRELVQTLLEPFDVEIQTAENGAQAVSAMQEGAFDLVLMDVQMPVMDGLTATRAIRALPHEAARTTPIIAMTANVLPDQVSKCLAAGMDDHLGKPISPSALLTALAHWADRSRPPEVTPEPETLTG